MEYPEGVDPGLFNPAAGGVNKLLVYFKKKQQGSNYN